MALTKTTQDREEIQQWAEARGAKPAVVASTESEEQTGILRLMFPDAPNANDGSLEEIEWDEFFEKFEGSGLEFIYQEETADGQKSNFNKLTYPEADSPAGKKLMRKTSAKKTSAKKSSTSKSPAKKMASKAATKKSPAKKGAAKAPAKKAPARKAPAKKASAKAAAKKSPTRKASAKASAKKAPAKKAVAKKVSAKKSSQR